MKLVEAHMCIDCEEIFPFHFQYCPKCGSIATIALTKYIPSAISVQIKERDEKSPYWLKPGYVEVNEQILFMDNS